MADSPEGAQETNTTARQVTLKVSSRPASAWRRLVLEALGQRGGAGVGHEVVVHEEQFGGCVVRAEHRFDQGHLQPERVDGVREGAEDGAAGPQVTEALGAD